MASKTADPVIMRVGSHYVTLGTGTNPSREECYGYINTTWRGRPAIVTMAASRYTSGPDRDHQTWTEWQVYANEAREGRYVIDPSGSVGTWPEHGGERGDPLTDLARSRLSEDLKPMMREWLESPEYAASENLAYYSAVKREAYELRPWDTATRDLRRAISSNAHKLTERQRAHLGVIADRFDAFAAVYNEEVAP